MNTLRRLSESQRDAARPPGNGSFGGRPSVDVCIASDVARKLMGPTWFADLGHRSFDPGRGTTNGSRRGTTTGVPQEERSKNATGSAMSSRLEE
jgi:hypothetical protein